jgi:signal transduction histidine kinase
VARLVSVGRPCTSCAQLARLRRDLHDGLGPTLAGILARADVLAALLSEESRDAREVVGELRQEASSFLGEMRRVLADREPAELEGRDLSAGLSALGARMSAGVDIEVSVGDVSQASWDSQVTAFWIVKEALTNVLKHAQASSCVVRVWTDNGIRLSVVDDGRGSLGRPGLGLSSMRERAAERGGWCDVSDTGHGISVTAHVPDWECHDRAA